MLARFRFAALAAVSCAGLAAMTALAQDTAPQLADLITGEVVELQLTTEQGADAAAAPFVYEFQAADQSLAVAADAVVEENAEVEEPAGLWLGVQLATEIPPALAHHLGDAKGALVETVYPESPAAESGIEAYDLIVRLDVTDMSAADIESNEDLIETMKNAVDSKPIDVVVLRGGEKKTISVTPRKRQPAQLAATSTAQFRDTFYYSVPHMRVLPALGGPDAGEIRHRLLQAYGHPASLPENVESMKVRVERDGDKAVHHVEVTTVDGKTFKASNEEELKTFPPDILAALPLPQNRSGFALRIDATPGSPAAQRRIVIQTAPGVPAAPVLPAPLAVPASPLMATPQTHPTWVDIIREPNPAAGNFTYKAIRFHQPGEELSEVKKELSNLRAAVERIEKLMQKDE